MPKCRAASPCRQKGFSKTECKRVRVRTRQNAIMQLCSSTTAAIQSNKCQKDAPFLSTIRPDSLMRRLKPDAVFVSAHSLLSAPSSRSADDKYIRLQKNQHTARQLQACCSMRRGVREPTFPVEMRAVLIVLQHFFGQTLPRLNRREQQFTFVIIAQNHLQHLDWKKIGGQDDLVEVEHKSQAKDICFNT